MGADPPQPWCVAGGFIASWTSFQIGPEPADETKLSSYCFKTSSGLAPCPTRRRARGRRRRVGHAGACWAAACRAVDCSRVAHPRWAANWIPPPFLDQQRTSSGPAAGNACINQPRETYLIRALMPSQVFALHPGLETCRPVHHDSRAATGPGEMARHFGGTALHPTARWRCYRLMQDATRATGQVRSGLANPS